MAKRTRRAGSGGARSIRLGYKLSSEEQGPRELVRLARAAEDAGFSFALISDHFHPWTDRQGQSPFVWSVIGAIAKCLKDHPKAYPEGISVVVTRLGPSSLDIEASASFETTSVDEFSLIRQDLLLGLVELVNASGARLASPSQKLVLEGGKTLATG